MGSGIEAISSKKMCTRGLVFGGLSDPQSLNMYIYCRNNLYKYIESDSK